MKTHSRVSLSASLGRSDAQQVPSEFKISEKWDVCLERTVINFGMGVVAAGLAGVVLTRECIDSVSQRLH